MDARPLNLQDAFRLASLISQYVDVEQISPRQNAVDFISSLVEKISPQEYLLCVALLTQTDEETIKKYNSFEILHAFVEGLKLNQIVSLLHFYKSL